MYLAWVSVHRVEDISEALWGSKVSASTISELNPKLMFTLRNGVTESLKASIRMYMSTEFTLNVTGGEFENVSILVAIVVNSDGYREGIVAAEELKECKESWTNFLSWLRKRGLKGIKMIVGDKCLGMCESVNEVFPEAKYQRCTVHFYRDVFTTPRSQMCKMTRMLKEIHA